MNITKAGIEDIPLLAKLVNQSYRGEHSRIGWTTEADLFSSDRVDAAALQRMMDHDGAVIFKYLEAGELWGCVYLKKEDASLYLGMLTVSPLQQNKGIGKKLLHHAEMYGKEQGCDRISMRVIDSRSELIEWYTRHGYRLTPERIPYPGDSLSIPARPIQFAVLEKELGTNPK